MENMDADVTWPLDGDAVDSCAHAPLLNPRVKELRKSEGKTRGGGDGGKDKKWEIDRNPNPPESNPELENLRVLTTGEIKSKIISLKNNHRRSVNPENESKSLDEIIYAKRESNNSHDISLQDYAKEKNISYKRPEYGFNKFNRQKQNRRNGSDEDDDDENNDDNGNWKRRPSFNRNNDDQDMDDACNWKRRPSCNNNDDTENMDGNCNWKNRQSFGNNRPVRKQPIVDDSTKVPKITPMSGLRLLCESGCLFDQETFEMKDENHPDFQKRRWRVVIYDGKDPEGEIKGMGEAPRKALAKECALLDVVEKMRVTKPDFDLPEVEIPKGSRINPFIVVLLEKFCKEKELREPEYSQSLVVNKGREKFQVSLVAGDQAFRDFSFDAKYAKFGVAKKAFETLSGRQFTLDAIIRGKDCLVEAEYACRETEQIHIVHSTVDPPSREVGYDSCISSVAGSPVPWAHDSADGESGRDTPNSMSSGPSNKRIKIATSSTDPLPPVLAQLRKRLQEKSVEIDVSNGAVSIDNLPDDVNLILPNDLVLEAPIVENGGFVDSFHPDNVSAFALHGNRKRTIIESRKEDLLEGTRAPEIIPKPILKGIKRTAVNSTPSLPFHKFLAENWASSIKEKVTAEMEIWKNIADEEDDPVAGKKKNVLTITGVGFSNALNFAEKAACINCTTNIDRFVKNFNAAP